WQRRSTRHGSDGSSWRVGCHSADWNQSTATPPHPHTCSHSSARTTRPVGRTEFHLGDPHPSPISNSRLQSEAKCEGQWFPLYSDDLVPPLRVVANVLCDETFM
ncbi:hypothetical protein BC830DRAFT_1157876, partial [Chytriomyces sp. MP71]